MEAREGRIGNAFACERCRKHKVRCVPSDTASICLRCQKARVECIEHVARRRPAKSRSDGQTPTRMRDFDKNLDRLSAAIATIAPSPPQAALPLVATIPSQPTETLEKAPTPAATDPTTTAPAPRTAFLSASGHKSAAPLPFWDAIDDNLSSLGRLDPIIRSISAGHMQILLDTYQSMVVSFPFVPLPKSCSCQDLVHSRPMLMFAVLTVASYDSIHVQSTLSREFRKVVMVKIMKGEKSLDLLQGLLVFLAWHHHYMDVQAVSIPMLLQLCIGIGNDLGLDNISTSVGALTLERETWHREAKRAYLGCYYLASNIALLEPGKARFMTYSATLRNYASGLASIWENNSDAVIPILVDVCQFIEDVDETFRGQSLQVQIARFQVKRLSEKWNNIQATSKLQAHDFRTLQWLQLAARTHLYRTAASIELADRDNTPWASGFQLSLRLDCLRSIEQFLENCLKLLTNHYDSVALIDWLNLVSMLINLSKLGLQCSPMSGWDPAELQIVKLFEYFRDQLSSQMPRPRDAQESTEDVFERFRRTTAVMKTALRNVPTRGSPNGRTFELATGSGRKVSLLQELPLPKINGSTNGTENLPNLWQVNPPIDINSKDFHWRFLLGTV